MATPFEQLDFVYMPSRDVAADVRYFTDVLGAELVFAIDAMGTRVAMVKLADAAPALLLADHVEGDQPILVYRVGDLDSALADLQTHGWKEARSLELPMGPASSFTTPGGQRIALYESTRPGVVEGFAGRRDF
jgi:glyoxalase/bleomycin resistance protein/dioxygenase superfamily protein